MRPAKAQSVPDIATYTYKTDRPPVVPQHQVQAQRLSVQVNGQRLRVQS